MHARRIAAATATFAVALALLVAPAPALAATDAIAPTTVPLEGTLRVIPVEAPPEHLTVDAPGDVPAPLDAGDGPAREVDVTLFTDDGAVVELATDGPGSEQWEGVASGSRFEGTVAVPEELVDAVTDEATAQGIDLGDPAGAELVAEVAAAEAVALPVVEATIDAPAAPDEGDSPTLLAAAAPREHTLDVLWLANPGTAAPSAGDIQAAVGRLSEFWNSQSNGQISQVRLRTSVQFRTVSISPCDQRATWTYAAGQFGRTEQSYWDGATASHLVVLTAASACGPAVGLATYGSGIHSGGLAWGTIELGRPTEWDQVTFHEFGHNIGLSHSNARECSPPIVDSIYLVSMGGLLDPACLDVEYRDRYDVMGGGFWIASAATGERIVSTMRNIPALSVTHKVKLDALPRGSALRTMTIAAGATQTATILPASSTTGLRGLELVDPLTGERLYVEYRSGTGRDAQSLYTQWPALIGTSQYAPGVRVMRSIADSCALECTIGYSTVLQRHASPDVLAPWLGIGDSIMAYDGAVAVRVVDASAAGATVEVSFSDRLQEFTTSAAPTLQGAARWGGTLSISGGAAGDWMPQAAVVGYQWFRNGSPVTGATRTTYTLTSADIGASIRVRVTANRPGFVPASAESNAVAVTAPTTSRVSGPTRYETAVAVSKRAFPGTAPVVYLATGVNYPDALAAAAAAAKNGGPLLLVPSSGTVPAAVLNRIAELAPSRIVVAGGESVVPAQVVAQVRARHPDATIDRLAGADRYATSRALVGDAFRAGADTVYVATGANYPDALSAGAAAGSLGAPVMLVNGSAARLDAASRAAIAALNPSRVLVVGGTGVVSEGVVADLTSIAPVTRLAGPSRFETSAAIADEAFRAPVAEHYWATGLGFPDALTGAVLAAVRDAPLLVVRPTCVPPAVASHAGRTGVGAVTLIGGPGVLGTEVAALRMC